MNNEFIKDISKHVKNSDIGSRELKPGEKGRRYEPEGGVKKHNQRIHRESRFANDYKNLPFQFSKPAKSAKSMVVRCLNCGYITSANKNTVGIICPECKVYSGIEEVING